MKKQELVSLKLQNLVIGWKSSLPLNLPLSLEFNSPSLIGLLANNGTGKSTLLQTMNGSLKPLSGTVLVSDIPISNLTEKVRAEIIANVFTDKIAIAGMKVSDLIALGRYPYLNFWKKLGKEDNHIIHKYASLCGIEHLLEKRLDELSDGERQKAALVKALVQETPIILMDEPTAFLDYKAKQETFEFLRAITISENKLILIASHDIDGLFAVCDYYLLMNKNKTSEFNSIKQSGEVELLKKKLMAG